MTTRGFTVPVVRLLAVALAVALSAAAITSSGFEQTQRTLSDSDWCRDAGENRDRATFCEVREFTIASPSQLTITDSPNGSVQVTGSARNDVVVRARVAASADTDDDARALVGQVRVQVENGRVRTDGPTTRGRRSWWVSYRAETPAAIDLELGTANGSVDVNGVRGRIRADSANGSIRLAGLGGDVVGRSSNGSVHVTLTGTRWEGQGLDATTANGSVRIDIPEGYNARLVTGTRNGHLEVDFPIPVRGTISRELDTTLGSGGATIRVQSANGSVRIGRR
jgi:hypothetical protein